VTWIRRLGALTLAASLAAGIVAFGPGTAAQAEGSGIKSPADKAVIAKGTTTKVTAHLGLLTVGKLFVDDPGSGGERQIASGTGPKDISNTVDITRNGVYTVRLKGLLGEIIDQQTFSVRIPPARPSGVAASLSGEKLIVRWGRGGSDLTGYDVFLDGTRARHGSPSALCGAEICSTALSVPASGGNVDVGVRAYRPDGTGNTIASDLSTASVSLPVSTSGGRGLGALPSQSAGPLLPLQGRSPLALPTVAPNGATPGFQYPAPSPQIANPSATGANAQNASAASTLRWGKSVAVALIMLVVAAHLGMWTRRMRLAQTAVQPTTTTGDTPRSRTERARRTQNDQPDEDDTAARSLESAATTRTSMNVAAAAASARPARPEPGDPSTVRPPTGNTSDADGTVADTSVLSAAASPTRPRPGHADNAAPTSPVPSAAASRAGTTGKEVKARTQRSSSRAKRYARHAAGYRDRRRTD
jgi:hypothetical protein